MNNFWHAPTFKCNNKGPLLAGSCRIIAQQHACRIHAAPRNQTQYGNRTTHKKTGKRRFFYARTRNGSGLRFCSLVGFRRDDETASRGCRYLGLLLFLYFLVSAQLTFGHGVSPRTTVHSRILGCPSGTARQLGASDDRRTQLAAMIGRRAAARRTFFNRDQA